MPNQREYVDSFLNDIERVHLQKIADDPDLQAVVKKVLLGGIYANGTLQKGIEPKPDYNCAFSYLNYLDANGAIINDAQVGAEIRALHEGIKALKYGFDLIEEYKTPKESNDKEINKAR